MPGNTGEQGQEALGRASPPLGFLIAFLCRVRSSDYMLSKFLLLYFLSSQVVYHVAQ